MLVESTSNTSQHAFEAARFRRELEFNASVIGDKAAERERLFREEIPRTQAYWIEHCVVCFVHQEPFDHERSMCSKKINQVVKVYKDKVGTWGKGQCWGCLLPMNCCRRWIIPNTGYRTYQNPLPDVKCVNVFAVKDTWACLWEFCPELAAIWTKRIREKEGEGWSAANNAQFKKYFQQWSEYEEDHRAGQVILDLTWLTLTYFENQDDPWDKIRSDSAGLQ